jgi:uncharacterized protein (TIGR03435 family)
MITRRTCRWMLAVLALVSGAKTTYSQKAPAFDVASIRPSSSEATPSEDEIQFLAGGRFYARNVPLAAVIERAYSIRDFQLLESPAWTYDWKSGRFNIQASGDAKATAEAVRAMAQTLLADRFNLRCHREVRNLSVHVLTQTRQGARLAAAKDAKRAAGEGGVNFAKPGLINGRNVSMKKLVVALTEITGGTVLDETGWSGPFDFELSWAVDQERSEVQQGSVGADLVVGATVYKALEEQLGLRLTRERRAIDVIVVDHIERPSAN